MEIARLQIAVDSTQAKNAGKDLQALEGNAKNVAKEAGAMGKAIGAAAAAFATGALVNWITATTKGIAELEKFSRLAGSSAERFQAVSFGAERFGVGADKLSDILKDVNDKVGDFLQTGAGPMADFFENIAPRVGVTADQFRNLSGPDALQLYVTSLEKANVSQAEMTFFMEAIANDATLLIPLFANSGAELSRFSDEASRLGLILDTETIQQARLFNESLATMGAVTSGVGKRVVADMLPALNDLTGTMIELGTQTDAANTAADIIGGTLKGLATVAIVIGAAFKTTGAAIGAVAAALFQAAQGDFKAAWETIKAGTQDYEDTTTGALNRIERLWDGSAAKTAIAANQANNAIQKLGNTTQSVADKPVKRLAASMTDAQLATEANAAVIIDLAESIYQASLSADELAERQARLTLNEYATPEQIASVQMLAGELQRLENVKNQQQAAEQNTQLLGQVDPIFGAQAGFQKELEDLRLLNEAKLLEDARYLDLKGQAERAHAEQMRILQEENFRAQSTQNELLFASIDQLGAATTDVITGLVTGANNGEEAIRSLAGSILNEAVSAVVQMGIQYVKSAVMGQTAAATGSAAAIALGTATATALGAAYAAPAALASLASFGANSVPATVGLTSTVALAKTLALASFDGGGFTGSGARSGGMDGKGGFMAMLHPNETVLDHTKGQGNGGGGVTINVIESKDKAGQQETRTDADGKESVDVFVSDIYGDGPRGKAIQRAFGLSRVGQ